MEMQIRQGRTIRKISDTDPVFIIVEVGSTHCASMETARRLIDEVSRSGADCVKFQKRDVNALLTGEGQRQAYQSKHAMAPTYGEHRRVMEFNETQFLELQEYAVSKNLFFTASAWDGPSVDLLDRMDVPFIKVASADLTNLPLLHHIGSKQRPVIMSTGMASLEDVVKAYTLLSAYKVSIGILQCTSTYPCLMKDVNLNVITTLRGSFPSATIGYSGHESGPFIPVAAVSLGARIIEKHLTLDKAAKGSDHLAALDPTELTSMVAGIRDVEQAMGSSTKQLLPCEIGCVQKLCKSTTSTVRIPKNTVITREMLTTKSPGTGISAKHIERCVGLKTVVDIEPDTTLMPEMVIRLEGV